jgi:ribokinase
MRRLRGEHGGGFGAAWLQSRLHRQSRKGKLQIDCFKTEGVNTDGIIEAQKGKSGSVMGFVDKKGARALYINSGVNDLIEPREMKWEYVAQAKFLHLSSFVGEKSFRAQKKLIGSLPSEVKVSFDPGSLYAQKGFAAIEPLIRSSHVMMPNEIELGLLTGEPDIPTGALRLIEAGVQVVAVKLGSKGCYVTDGQERRTIESFKVKVIDTTGAGDAFNAGFLYGLLHDKTLAECGRLGNFVAAQSVTVMGARQGLPREADLAAI